MGCIAVSKDRRIAAAHNLSVGLKDPTAHAEILCLRRAARRLQNYRLPDIMIYVTMEPCAMCAGAMIWSRVKKVVFGCWDEKAGACGTVLDLSKVKKFNHRFEVFGGVMEKECRQLMQKFFRKKR